MIFLKRLINLGKSIYGQMYPPYGQDRKNRVLKPYAPDFFQVVGHTPVKEPLVTNNILTVDTFSTYSDGSPIGDQRFVWVDTVEKSWDYT